MENSESMNNAVQTAVNTASQMHHEYITPEHLLYGLTQQVDFKASLWQCDANDETIRLQLKSWLETQEKVGDTLTLPIPSLQFTDVMKNALKIALRSNARCVDAKEYVEAILMLQDSMAAYILGKEVDGKEAAFFSALDTLYGARVDEDDYEPDGFMDAPDFRPENWKTLVTDISEEAKTHTPLIGREMELDRTIQILCRMEKNNPLHVGDPGVGKTAIIYGLADMINHTKVPGRIRGCKIYGVEMGQLLAGAQ